ncbi:hypothetical protein BDB01DRAFT_839100 [Pilobolus umbonatus]|nr:hypothetical protein BDB01DRAFT_839100 [Pilobolus umbonatus]
MVQTVEVMYVDTVSEMFKEGKRIIEEGASKVNLKEDFTRREWLELQNKERKKKDNRAKRDGDTALKSLGPYSADKGTTIGLCYEKGKTPYELRRYKFMLNCDCDHGWSYNPEDSKDGTSKMGFFLRVEVDGYVKEIALSSFQWNKKAIDSKVRYVESNIMREFYCELDMDHCQIYNMLIDNIKNLMTGSDIVDVLDREIEFAEIFNFRYCVNRKCINKLPYNTHLPIEDLIDDT